MYDLEATKHFFNMFLKSIIIIANQTHWVEDFYIEWFVYKLKTGSECLRTREMADAIDVW